MIQELDIVSLTRSISTVDVDGDEVLLKAGTQGTVMVGQTDGTEFVVEFGEKPDHMTMVSVNKKDLKLIWSHEQQLHKKFAG